VFLAILKDIDERVPNLPWPLQVAPVPPICPKPAAAAKEPIHAARDAHHQSADAGRKSLVVFGLDDEVYVILLHGVVHHTKRLAIAVAQPTEQRARYLLRAQRSQTRAQRDVHRVRLTVSRPRSMRRLPQISRSRLAPSTWPRATTPLRLWE